MRERYLIGDRALICEFKPLKECHKRMFRGWKAEPFARAPRKTYEKAAERQPKGSS